MNALVLNLPDGESIPYLLERRSRHTVGLKIGHEGLIVHAPKRISQSQLEQLLITKAGWIRSKLEARQDYDVAPMEWLDGSPLLLLGNDVTLQLRQDTRSRNIEHAPGILTVALPDTNNQQAIARKVLQWYRKQALADFSRRIEILAARLGVPAPKLFLSNAQSRWGSCNSKQEVRLNWRLIQAPPHIINYVICHELAHLKEMNHSARFWAIVESLYPDYKQAEKALKTLSSQLHVIG